MHQIKRILIIRLSSLGDIVLTQDSLKEIPLDIPVDWLIKKGNEISLLTSSSIQTIHSYERDLGESSFKALLQISKILAAQKYSLVLDLHSVPKTAVLRLFMLFYAIAPYHWFRLSKPRLKRLLFILLKEKCPVSLRPGRYALIVRAFTNRCLNKVGVLNEKSKSMSFSGESHFTAPSRSQIPKTMFGVSPGSMWMSKQWSAENFRQICQWVYQNYQLKPVLLGLLKEQPVQELKHFFKANQIPYEMSVDSKTVTPFEDAISQCSFVISNDSFAAHISESLDIPVVMLFGPTHPDYGYGPRLSDSQSVHTDLWCSPCSKDGSLCFRFGESRYKCLEFISLDSVQAAIKKIMSRKTSPEQMGYSHTNPLKLEGKE